MPLCRLNIDGCVLMVVENFRRRIRRVSLHLPIRGKVARGPAFLYRDFLFGEIEQALRLVNGCFLFDRAMHPLDLENPWGTIRSDAVKAWLYSFVWLEDLQALGTNEARLVARRLILAWAESPPQDRPAQEPGLMGQRLANWLGYYEFCLITAREKDQQHVMESMMREGRILAALLPLEPCGWYGLAALRGLLAAFMAQPEQEGFYQRFLRYLPPELARTIFADGTVAERSPEAQFQTVRELVALSSMFAALQLPVPPVLQKAVRSTCAVLRALCHDDGGLALFNGSSERNPAQISTLLDRAERYRVINPVLPQGGFIRLHSGTSLLLVDAASPPAYGFDINSHAGTLSLEFSADGHRLLVNSGSALSNPWKDALRQSVAHNVAVPGGESSSEFSTDGHIIRKPTRVSASYKTDGISHWLDLSHNGYHASLGATWQRSLYFGKDGAELRGKDSLGADSILPCVIRFYLHPDLHIILEDEEVILSVPGEEIFWRFRQSGGVLEVADSIYLGREQLEKNKQIVISAPINIAPPPGEEKVEDGQQAGKTGQKRYHRSVSWILERVPA